MPSGRLKDNSSQTAMVNLKAAVCCVHLTESLCQMYNSRDQIQQMRVSKLTHFPPIQSGRDLREKPSHLAKRTARFQALQERRRGEPPLDRLGKR